MAQCNVYSTFSPLFIAAMVATAHLLFYQQTFQVFQSAFHRGNGCYNNVPFVEYWKIGIFQSAFHRGNGCYQAQALQKLLKDVFQSAFHRGNGCYNVNLTLHNGIQLLSVRFSSRQWLLLVKNGEQELSQSAFSPLFIGAMVATSFLQVLQ